MTRKKSKRGLQKMRCKHFEDGICSSCTLLSLKEQEALSYKLKKTTEILQIKAFDSITTSPSNNYRNKAKWAVSGSLEAPRFGFFDKELSFHELVHCPILMSSLDQMQSILKKVIYDFKLTPYDPNSGQGELKYILLFSDPEQKNFILRFVLRSKEAIDRIKNFVLRKDEYLLQDVKVISVNLQPLNAAIIEGEEEIILTEEKDISFKLDKTFFFLGVRSFFQVNHQIAQML